MGLCEYQLSTFTKFEMESTALTWEAIQRLKVCGYYPQFSSVDVTSVGGEGACVF